MTFSVVYKYKLIQKIAFFSIIENFMRKKMKCYANISIIRIYNTLAILGLINFIWPVPNKKKVYRILNEVAYYIFLICQFSVFVPLILFTVHNTNENANFLSNIVLVTYYLEVAYSVLYSRLKRKHYQVSTSLSCNISGVLFHGFFNTVYKNDFDSHCERIASRPSQLVNLLLGYPSIYIIYLLSGG